MLSGCHQHDFTQTKTITKTTCTEDGEYEYTCKECKKVEYRKVKAAGHHDWEPATCQAPKTCKKCRTTEGGKGDHIFDDNGCCKYCTARYEVYHDPTNINHYYFNTLGDPYEAIEIKKIDYHYNKNTVTVTISGIGHCRHNNGIFENGNFSLEVIMRNSSSELQYRFLEKNYLNVRLRNDNETFQEDLTFNLLEPENYGSNYYLFFSVDE